MRTGFRNKKKDRENRERGKKERRNRKKFEGKYKHYFRKTTTNQKEIRS